jgi:hypothetical protein
MASDPDEQNEILEALERVLDPLEPARRAEVVEWAKAYLAECPLVSYLCAEGEPGDLKVYEFKMAEPSPLDPGNTIFAIFHWFAQGVFVVYSFRAVALEDGSAAGTFTRDVVHKPRFASGPVTLQAMHADLEYHLHSSPWDDGAPDDPDDDGPLAGNGSGRPHGARP